MAEPTTGVRFAGVLRDGSGNLITSGVTANSYDIGTTTPTRGTEDSTFTSGKFAIADSGFGRFDVKIVNGSEQIWWSSLAEVQVTSLQARNPTTASAALEVFSTTDETSSLVAVFGFRPSLSPAGQRPQTLLQTATRVTSTSSCRMTLHRKSSGLLGGWNGKVLMSQTEVRTGNLTSGR